MGSLPFGVVPFNPNAPAFSTSAPSAAPPADATADMLAANGATPAPPSPPPTGSGDATADMLAANGATQVQPTQPAKRSVLKSMLMNFAQGMGKSLEYQAGIPQRDALVAQTATTKAKLPYVAPEAQADLSYKNTQTAMQQELMKPVQVPVTGPDGKMTIQTMPAFLAEKYIPQVIKYQNNQDKINSTEGIAKDKLDAQLLGLGYKRDDQGNLIPIPKNELSPILQTKASGAPSMARWVNTLNDPTATDDQKQVAQRNIKLLNGLQTAQQEAKGRSFAYNRGLYQWQSVYDPQTGVNRPMQGWEIDQRNREGNPVTASGRLSTKDILSVQQLASEATPAIENVEKNVGAYDNSKDRAIFARIIDKAGKPAYGQESGWMGTILNQALKSDLSPQGQALVRDLSRLNETVGRFRSIMGAPSTDTQMSLAMALLPGASTPSSTYAKEQLKNFKDMVKLGVDIPLLSGKSKGETAPTNTPPAGAKVRDYTQLK